MLRIFSYPHRLKSGHLTCYLNRTYHVLTTSRQVPVEKRRRSPYGTDICWRAWCCWARSRRGCPPLFLWQREGFREHAVALSLPTAKSVGVWLAVRSLQVKEIGYGQQ